MENTNNMKSIPNSAKKISLKPVALGEVTGHHHSFMSNNSVAIGSCVEMYEDTNGTIFVKALQGEGEAALVHQEHKAHSLIPGVSYRANIQNEYSDEGWKQARD